MLPSARITVEDSLTVSKASSLLLLNLTQAFQLHLLLFNLLLRESTSCDEIEGVSYITQLKLNNKSNSKYWVQVFRCTYSSLA